MRRVAVDVARLGFVALGVAAMTYQYADTADTAFRAANFFSFFTIQSNILAVTVLALTVVVRAPERTILFDAVRGAVTLYMALTGVVFALLLSGLQEELQTTIPWVDFVVHKLLPVVLVADWLLEPPRHRLRPWVAAAWLAYPAVWLAYTLIRGAGADWYPYPFVDVDKLGYDGVFLRCLVLLAGLAAAAAALLWLGNRRAARWGGSADALRGEAATHARA